MKNKPAERATKSLRMPLTPAEDGRVKRDAAKAGHPTVTAYVRDRLGLAAPSRGRPSDATP